MNQRAKFPLPSWEGIEGRGLSIITLTPTLSPPKGEGILSLHVINNLVQRA
jgi:hypothetical protein